jgi:hypothetical protein
LWNAAEIHHDVTLALCRPEAGFSKSCAIHHLVMPGLDPGIHVLLVDQRRKTWMAGLSPAMTK